MRAMAVELWPRLPWIRLWLPRLGQVSRWRWVAPELAAWVAASSGSLLIPSPAATAAVGWELAASGQLWVASAASLTRVTTGLVLVVLSAVPLGTLLGLSPRLLNASSAVVALARALPPIAWLPLLVVFWGLQERTSLTLIWVGAFFPLLINTTEAVRGVEKLHLDAATVLDASRWQRVAHVVLPAALPGILVGIRYSLSLAWMLVVVAELAGARSGLGYLILNATLDIRLDKIVVGIAVIAILGFALDRLYLAAAARLSPLLRLQEEEVLAWR
ncbi:MAG: ABC transporter permease [Chloroflexota bacterium]|nr:ABC transporter permease [Chloroflexota bacterium]